MNISAMTEKIKRNKVGLIHVLVMILVIVLVMLVYPSSPETYIPQFNDRAAIPDSLLLNRAQIIDLIESLKEPAVSGTTIIERGMIIFGGILTGLFALLNYLRSRGSNKIHEAISALVSRFDKNDKEHAEIIKELAPVRDDVARRNVMCSLGTITQRHLKKVEDGTDERAHFRMFITSVGDRTEQFADDIMAEVIVQEVLEQAYIRASIANEESQRQARSIYFEDFYSRYIQIQGEHVNKMLSGLQRIADDKIRNDKYRRFRDVCNEFLEGYMFELVTLFRMQEEKTKLIHS